MNTDDQIKHLEARVARLMECNEALSDTNGKLALARVTMETERDALRAELDAANEKLRSIAAPAVRGVLSRMSAPPMDEVMEAMRENLAVLDRVKSERDAWQQAALNTGLYRSGTDVSTPEKWRAAQAAAAVDLISRAEKAEAQSEAEVSNRKAVEMNRAAWEHRAARTESLVERCREVVTEFVVHNPKFRSRHNGEMQDPMGAHELLADLLNARNREVGGGGGFVDLPPAEEKYNHTLDDSSK